MTYIIFQAAEWESCRRNVGSYAPTVNLSSAGFAHKDFTSVIASKPGRIHSTGQRQQMKVCVFYLIHCCLHFRDFLRCCTKSWKNWLLRLKFSIFPSRSCVWDGPAESVASPMGWAAWSEFSCSNPINHQTLSKVSNSNWTWRRLYAYGLYQSRLRLSVVLGLSNRMV